MSQPPLLILLAGLDDPASAIALTAAREIAARCTSARTASETAQKFHAVGPDAVVLDLDLPDAERLLHHLGKSPRHVPVLALAASASPLAETDLSQYEFMKILGRPFGSRDVADWIDGLRRSHGGDGQPPTSHDANRVEFFATYTQLFRNSKVMSEVERTILLVADTSVTVLVEGETGVGKELVARAIHYLSDRATRPWLKVNCASLPGELLESELFGYERGAFTGAHDRKLGLFELARGGTILLDEIGEMPLSLQAKLLHVLQDGQFFRVGGRNVVTADARIIAATNKDLQAMVAEGQFRGDLYYRLNVVSILVPPLRERREEIPFLVEAFRGRFAQEFGRPAPDIPPDAMALLTSYAWPGNVRELENVIKRCVALGDIRHLSDTVRVRSRLTRRRPLQAARTALPGSLLSDVRDIGLVAIGRRAAASAEQAAVLQVLEDVQWNRVEAARVLKVSYKTLLTKLAQMGMCKRRRARGTLSDSH